MSSTRLRALHAAVELVGGEGIRALTHGRVDAAAALPPGSTSNHFRTRTALVTGVIEWIAAEERADAGLPSIRTRDDLVAGFTRMIEVQSGPQMLRTRARYALFLEADAEAAQPLLEQRAVFEAWIRGILRDLGGESAERQTRFLMATAEGALLHRMTVDPDAPVEAVIARAVDAALAA
ncbi:MULTISPECIES: TetR family transcriptional regulator [unclassified Microbacterium]|uniref:TetR/AcrR family transcriptional regulator n=1 Tax=unclassified Microbacterium TaxID=2609290 RepID=UPI00214CFC83|nr:MULTISPECIES: TetR family transcriptional regulator [unclassified Microbacterium]MCR2784095.1 TetR family transcriptional regulator [Microbacterium sp. zg.B96]WIM15067.1 TetR family transcriptional regulator [Microbacterium sp. zg-B96]